MNLKTLIIVITASLHFQAAFAQLDIGISELLAPTEHSDAYEQVKVRLTNYGTETLQSCLINWNVNGIDRTPYTYVGPRLAAGKSIDLNIGGFPFLANGTYVFDVYTSQPNGTTEDANPSNDRITTTLVGELENLRELDAGILKIFDIVPNNEWQLVQVIFKNFGIETIENVIIEYSINGEPQSPFVYVSPLMRSRDEIDLYIGGYQFNVGESYEVTVRTRMPNGQTDLKPANDSFTITF